MHPKKKRVSRSSRVCSVGGCSNSEYRNPNLNFYSFPGRSYEVERRQKWIEAVRQTKKDDSWMPSNNSRICSIHFVGGKKSNIQAHKSYLPSIFYGISNSQKVSYVETATRCGASSEVAVSLVVLAHKDFNTQGSLIDVSQQNQSKIATISSETKDWTKNEPTCMNTMFCWTGQNQLSTHLNLFTEPNLQLNTAQKIEGNNIGCEADTEIVKEINKNKIVCGTNVELNSGFLGFASISNDETMRYLTGLSHVDFHSFLELMIAGQYGQPMNYEKLSKENSLLLFFMKIKLDLAFNVLSTFFCIDCTTATQIFFQVLETLVEQTKTWIFWPPKQSIRKKLPTSFQKFPTCRCIIIYPEISIDSPGTIEQRILTYSKCQHCFTVKFLIAITGDDFICYISKSYGGRATDNFIADDSGFLNLIETGDVVFANKEFPQIKSELAKRNATLVIPEFAYKLHLSEKIDENCKIASLNTHIKRAIHRVKSSGILNHITMELLPHIDAIIHVCCIIANMQPRIIKHDDENR